ncbi:RNA 2',3'-cyclic phosphodiesterase [Bacillus coreaensis]
MDKKTHFFYAVKIPSDTKKLVYNKLLPLQKEFPFQKWVHPEDYHITLAFLGNSEIGMLEKSIQFVSDALKKENTFPLEMEGLDTFGRKESPRIFWVRLVEQICLYEVRKKVFHACELAGYSLEKRPFHPHITVARKWKGDTLFTPESLQQKNPFVRDTISFVANEMVLYQTHLEREPKYEVIQSFKL